MEPTVSHLVSMEEVLSVAVSAQMVRNILRIPLTSGVANSLAFRMPDMAGAPKWIEMTPTYNGWVFVGRYNYIAQRDLRDPFELVSEMELRYFK